VWASVYNVKGSRLLRDAKGWLEQEFNTSQEMFFDYRTEVDDWDFVFTKQINGLMRRYRHMKDFGLINYGNDYDKTPAVWIDAVEIMEAEYKLAMDCKNGD